jgi:hypothetical protein
VVKEIARQADATGIKDYDCCCGACTEKMWIYGLPKGGAGAVRDDPVNCFIG